ncbi:MAG TPA: DnaB-like helicase C-terminal domain-containing protein [Salinivirgaceae bacterium]|nr:DnaB-like helicase C-terminal domain-containing protein [Salinivirgaceae bacterium]
MIKTENKELNSFWNLGLKPGGLIIIAARPAMGKTTILLSIGSQISRHHKTQLMSLETSASQLKQKGISDSILIDDTPAINLEHLSKIILQNNPEVVLIDYIQLMTGNRENLIKDLKNIAVKFNICLIVNSQIHRGPEYRALSDRRPIINDLTAGSSIFNSDNVAYIDNLTFLYRDSYYNRDSQEPDKIELIQYDNGNILKIQLDWISPT